MVVDIFQNANAKNTPPIGLLNVDILYKRTLFQAKLLWIVSKLWDRSDQPVKCLDNIFQPGMFMLL